MPGAHGPKTVKGAQSGPNYVSRLLLDCVPLFHKIITPAYLLYRSQRMFAGGGGKNYSYATAWVLGHPRVQNPNGISIGSAVLHDSRAILGSARLRHLRNNHTHHSCSLLTVSWLTLAKKLITTDNLSLAVVLLGSVASRPVTG